MVSGPFGNQSNLLRVPTTIKVYYYMPDCTNIIQEFWWQTLDIPPYYYRIHCFLNYWKNNIEATIKEVEISSNETITYSYTDILLNLKNNYC